MTASVFQILPTTQKYDWGKIGLTSKVAQFADAAKAPGFQLDEKSPYAELWMGTHSSSPSRLLDGTPLKDVLASAPSLIGDDVLNIFEVDDGNLPFLFKILAIRKALSIQTHPDKRMAERLHAERPDLYKDANHKPEMAIALTPFTALCGFLPLPQIATYLTSTPEFASLLPATAISNFLANSGSHTPTGETEKDALKELFSALMSADPSKYQPELAKLVKRYREGEVKEAEMHVKELVLQLESQYPGDIGVFCAFVLNYMRLSPGEAIFLGAGEPHAYISGDIVETMATSDNVIRAGLTPKLRDVPSLLENLTYVAAESTKHIVAPKPFGTISTIYDPPIPEFSVVRARLSGVPEEVHDALKGPSLFIVTEGSGKLTWEGEGGEDGEELSAGKVFFVGANTRIRFETTATLEVYRAFVESKPPSPPQQL
ncbi:mannos-6-phosphate isomerase [Schizopora paradoxa]|uniref:Mannose-6-phosphate isomerase n=1 Tax=Schizopora paradoxa TaxID=27342 RepID=A0A0H2S6Z5_9AGAM|nr:mannos-6-phosphate isomerase [Schizopora paradoxa]